MTKRYYDVKHPPSRQSFTSDLCRKWTRRISKLSFLGQTHKVSLSSKSPLRNPPYDIDCMEFNIWIFIAFVAFVMCFLPTEINRRLNCERLHVIVLELWYVLGQPSTCWRRCWRWTLTRGSPQRKRWLTPTLQRCVQKLPTYTTLNEKRQLMAKTETSKNFIPISFL